MIHKERFFTSNDEFVLDIAPNRLIKSTLNFLKSKTSLNKFRLIKSMQILDEVEFSKNYEKILVIKFQDILIIMKTCFCGVKFS